MYSEVYTLSHNPGWEKLKSTKNRQSRGHKLVLENGFWCKHCGAYVYTLPGSSGVQNRNHCPFCLWSRHVDHFQAGDRLSACKAIMQPIGLTLKQTRNKYACCSIGELMLIHRCRDCGKLSINRIAADDQAELVTRIYRASLNLDETTRQHLVDADIRPLVDTDESIVVSQLYGLLNLD